MHGGLNKLNLTTNSTCHLYLRPMRVAIFSQVSLANLVSIDPSSVVLASQPPAPSSHSPPLKAVLG